MDKLLIQQQTNEDMILLRELEMFWKGAWRLRKLDTE